MASKPKRKVRYIVQYLQSNWFEASRDGTTYVFPHEMLTAVKGDKSLTLGRKWGNKIGVRLLDTAGRHSPWLVADTVDDAQILCATMFHRHPKTGRKLTRTSPRADTTARLEAELTHLATGLAT